MSDPDPKTATVILHIWPWMFLLTLANLAFLVCIAGLLGPWIFLALPLCFVIEGLALWIFCRFRNRDCDLGTTEEETRSFILLAAISSIWLPNVVGHQPQRIFLVSGVVSLVTKVLLLAFAVALASSEDAQAHVYRKPFLLYCFKKGSVHLNQPDVPNCLLSKIPSNETAPALQKNDRKRLTHLEEEDWHRDYYRNVSTLYQKAKAEGSWENVLEEKSNLSSLLKFIEGSAFYLSTNQESVQLSTESAASNGQEGSATVPTVQCLQNSGKVQHKIRICENDDVEFNFRLCLLFGLLCVLALAAFSTYRLHKIADYKVKELLIKPSPDEFFSRSFSGHRRIC